MPGRDHDPLPLVEVAGLVHRRQGGISPQLVRTEHHHGVTLTVVPPKGQMVVIIEARVVRYDVKAMTHDHVPLVGDLFF